jgi:FkbM family methyltransferase
LNSYSQYQEDAKVFEILDRWQIGQGRMLEIGAYDPKQLSNSRAFIEDGWEAVLIEPSPAHIASLAREYRDNPHVTLLAAPVTVHGGIITLELTDDALSCETISEDWREKGGWYGRAKYLSISMIDLFTHFGGNFDVISIDTEGTSVNLFAEMIRIGPRPRVVIVEYDKMARELSQHAAAGNYRLAMDGENGTNRIYEWQGPK